ncbi:MAG: 50S ribosomal protein L20 [Candidatus Eisenbacteria bacterium]|uniref:Large ribosomal subunit protein bL20 n=1 Tax=Eiseniibacteriota bacterium TaxID=2212470 RepID=A0A7Y2EAG3_UNCEI|nr:50S ribosomal protein L20 [Candidatus Eisenbacteria bacterium]
MPRARGVVPGRNRRKKVLKASKGNFGGRSRLFKSANETYLRSLNYAYEHRRAKKRDFRKLWIVRINAAAREQGLSYSAFINGLKQANVEINRKVLAELAATDTAAFKELADVARQAGA